MGLMPSTDVILKPSASDLERLFYDCIVNTFATETEIRVVIADSSC